MEIVEYDNVDPIKVMYITRLAQDFAITPEMAVRIRLTEPRAFPCLAIYAVDGETILGQVGLFRLPMVSTKGREDVGGIWGVSTHPQYAAREIISVLLNEAHTRMREAGLRFSTMGIDRSRATYKHYLNQGYQETNVWATALARWEIAHQPTRLSATHPGAHGHDLVENIFNDVAKGYVGFAWRYTPFAHLRSIDLEDIWVIRVNNHPVGYAFAHVDETMLTIRNLTVQTGIDTAEAVAAVAAARKATYIQVKISRRVEMASLQRAGYYVANPNRSGFLIKPLLPEVSITDAYKEFGIGSDRFLISWLDITSETGHVVL